MPIQKMSIRVLLFVLTFSTLSFALTASADDDEYSFKVTNNTEQTIKKILVSEDGKKYGYFNIGNGFLTLRKLYIYTVAAPGCKCL